MSGSANQFDVAIVGGGIIGLAHAWLAARQGLKCVLFERDRRASGASVRNFGIVLPIGQTAGEMFELAIRSRSLWLELKTQAGLWVHECGSLHLARQVDEQAVLEEFVQLNSQANGFELLTPRSTLAKSQGVNPDGLLAGLWSPHELGVNPPQAIAWITDWLEKTQNISIRPTTTIVNIANKTLTTACGKTFLAERIVVCSGSDFETLFPESFRNAGLQKCKLQMLATPPQPNNWKLGPHLAGGLSLRHYASFKPCPSLEQLKCRIEIEKPRLNEFGIHVMVSQNDDGQVLMGDSHLYDEQITPFDSSLIESLILEELRSLIRLPDFSVQRRWHGIYAKHPEKHLYVSEPQTDCKIVVASGGAGMTLSFGLAERTWNTW